MKVLLIDMDSKIPNLALMKLSAYHKSRGDEAGFDITDPDKVYASVIFKKNKHLVDGLKFYYPNADIAIGGSGYNISASLPDEIESMKPDYTLYPECDYSIGFSTRGCIRKCHFCIVPDKEGMFRRAQHPEYWYNPEFDKIMFLDNNILADKEWFIEVTNWCIEKDLKVWFTQGLDIRLVDLEVAKQLLKIKTWKSIFFAWDHISTEPLIKNGISTLMQAGFTKSNLRSNVQFYVYVDSDSEYESGVYRCRQLKSMSCNPFVMYNVDRKPTKRIQELRRWANRKWAFWSCDIADYTRAVRA